MKISKGRKITAFVTLSIMLVAIAVTAGILTNVPKTYQGEDVAPVTTGNNYGIKSPVYDKDTTAMAFVLMTSGGDQGDLRVLFPRTIYLDKTETLTEVGYSIYYKAWASCSTTFNCNGTSAVIFDTVLGYYSPKIGNGNSARIPTAANATTMTTVFKDYNVEKNRTVLDGQSIQGGISNKDEVWDNANSGIDIVTARGDTVVQNKLLGEIASPNKDYIGKDAIVGDNNVNNAKFVFPSNSLIGYTKWKQGSSWKSIGSTYKYYFDANGGSSAGAQFYGNDKYVEKMAYIGLSDCIGASYMSNVEINIHIYDKSALKTAIDNFENNVLTTANKTALNKISGSDTLYTNAENYLKSAKSTLTTREVDQKTINEYTRGLNNYTFELGDFTTQNPSKYYDGNAVNISNTWTRFDSTYFDLTVNDSSTNTEIKNADNNQAKVYNIKIRPKTTKVNGMNLQWSSTNNNEYKSIGSYTINPAQLAFKAGALKTKVEYDYVNQNYNVNVISALSNGAAALTSAHFTDNTYYPTDNTLTLYAVVDEAGKNAATGINWSGVTANTSVVLKNAGTYTVYYKITATNHTDITGNFTVVINPKAFSVKNIASSWSKDFKNSAYTIDLAELAGGTVQYEGLLDGTPTVKLYLSDNLTINPTSVNWDSVNSTSVTMTDVGKKALCYKITAPNHVDIVDSLTATINKAKVKVEVVNDFRITFGSAILTSDEIIEQLVSTNTRVLDAQNAADSKNYLKQIAKQFAVTTIESDFVTGTNYLKVKAGNYTLSNIEVSDDWTNRIDSITYTNNSNSGAYVVTPKEISLAWTQQTNLWYDGSNGKRPSWSIVGGAIEGINVGVTTSVKVKEGASGSLSSDGDARNAGTYIVTAACSNTNFTVDSTSLTAEFTILPRPIDVTLVPRSREYASDKTADEMWDKYIELFELDSPVVYTATTTATDGKSAIAPGDSGSDVFEIAIIDGVKTDDGQYYKVNETGYTFQATLKSSNYSFITAKPTTTLKITKTDMNFSIEQIDSSFYTGSDRAVGIPDGANNSELTLKGYESDHRDEVVIKYRIKDSGANYSEDIPQIKDAGDYTIEYVISAPNHNDSTGDYEVTINRRDAKIDLTANSVVYGTPMPDSDGLKTLLGITITWSTDASLNTTLNDTLKNNVTFRIVNGNTAIEAGVVNTPVGEYNLSYALANGEKASNLSFTYTTDSAQASKRLGAYKVTAKSLTIDWKQSGTGTHGTGWSADGLKYTYDGVAPSVTPNAASTEGNVVAGDTITFAAIQLDDDIVGKYTAEAELSNENYTLANPTQEFEIVEREVRIYVKNQSVDYGNAKSVVQALGVALRSPGSGNAPRYTYATNDAAYKFIGEDYTHFAFSIEYDDSKVNHGLIDAGNYPIKVGKYSGYEGTVTDNYDVKIITDGAPEDKQATFTIRKANLRLVDMQFNRDISPDVNDPGYVTKEEVTNRIATGIEAITADDFDVEMSDLYKTGDTVTWVETQTSTITDATVGDYLLKVRITHKHNNFEVFEADLSVSVWTNWISITISNAYTAQYGDPVADSEELFEHLGITEITGIVGEDNSNKPLSEALTDLKSLVTLYVGMGDANATPMEGTNKYGTYSVYLSVIAPSADKHYRFKVYNDEPYASNINKYVVGQRKVGIDWGAMSEVYGDHDDGSESGTPSNSHKYTATNVLEDDKADLELTITYYTVATVDGKKIWTEIKQGHAKNVGNYGARVTGVYSPSDNYMLPTDETLEIEFQITARLVEIQIGDREITYGATNSTHTGINTFLNQEFATRYTVKSEKGFVDGDSVASVFKFKIGSYTQTLTYLPVADDYTIEIEQLDTAVSKNYQVVAYQDTFGTLKVKEANITYNEESGFNDAKYTGADQNVSLFDSAANVVLRGDSAELKKTMTVSYSFTKTGEFTTDLKIKDAGDYDVYVKVEADNHNDYVSENPVTLHVDKAYVEIFMDKTATKQYGVTEAELIKDTTFKNISDWLKANCNITYTTRDKDGKVYTVAGVADDFTFKVVQPGTGYAPSLEIGSQEVGYYRVFHVGDVQAGSAVMKNYDVSYRKVGEKFCTADKYQITKREVDVEWVTTGYKDESNKDKFVYSGNVVDVKAYVQLLGEENKRQLSVATKLNGSTTAAAARNAGLYTATASGDIFDSVDINKNYDFGKKTFAFEIVAKDMTVVINNVECYYGDDGSKVGFKLDASSYNEAFNGDPIVLSLDTKTPSGQYYNVGDYHIKGECTSKNYNVTFKGEDSENTYAIYKILPASLTIGLDSYSKSYNGKDFTVDLKDILGKELTEDEEHVYSGIVGDMTWDDVTVLYKQADGSWSATKPVVKGITVVDGKNVGQKVTYKVSLANYNTTAELTFTIHIDPARLEVTVSKGASSVYGNDLLSGDELFTKANARITSSSIVGEEIDLKSIIRIVIVDSENAVHVGNYSLGYEFINEGDDNLYDITLSGNGSAYSITQREVSIKWNYTEAFEYNKQTQTITATAEGILKGDVVNVTYDEESCSGVIVGKYVAKADSVDNADYKLGSGKEFEWEIAPKAIKVTWTAGNFTYDGNEHLVGAPVVESGLIGDDTSTTTVSGAQINAGKHTATAVATNKNYYISNNTFEFEIKQAEVDINWIIGELTYNGGSQAPTAQVAAGLVGEDKCDVTISGAQINAGTHIATATLTNSNYKIKESKVSQEYTIAQKAVTFTWTDTELTYTGEAQVPKAVVNASDVVAGDEVDFKIEGAQINANTASVDHYVAKVTEVTNSNYKVDSVKQTDVSMNYTIGKGVNEFKSDITLPTTTDKLPWTGEDKPQSKWGEVTVKYYSDADCTQEVTDISNAAEGTYWVKLTVAGTDNYDEISQVFEVVLEGGLNIIIVIIGAVVSLVLLLGAIAVVKSTNKKKHKGGAK